MQPGKSQLFDSLKDYLNNKQRLQPIIGLGSIIECVKVGSESRSTLYLCEVCVSRLTRADVRNHILGSHHRFNYIKANHPSLVSKWQESSELSKLAWPLMELAKMLEGKEGPGDVQLFELHDALYQKIETLSERNALTLVNMLKAGLGHLESFSQTTASAHQPDDSQTVYLHQRSDPDITDEADKKLYNVSGTTESKTAQILPEVSRNDAGAYLDTPLIGLSCIVEFQSEDGSSCCFICHCCRIRSNKNDLNSHLCSSSHLANYLMDIYPNRVISEDMAKDVQFLQSLAACVEDEEGRGEMKIVNVPEFICSQLACKSYHWCLKMLLTKWKEVNVQQKPPSLKGIGKTSPQCMQRSSAVRSKRRKRVMKGTNMKRKTNTLFSVSLPLQEGPLLLERKSFTMDSPIKVSASTLATDSSPPEIVDSGYFESNHDESTLELLAPELEEELEPGTSIKVTVFQHKDEFGSESDSSKRSSAGKETETHTHGDGGDSGAPVEKASTVGSQTTEWTPHQSYYTWDTSAFQQHPQTPWSCTTQAGTSWGHQVSPYFEAAGINMQTHPEEAFMQGGHLSSDGRGQLRPPQTYAEFAHHYYQPIPLSCMPQSAVCDGGRVHQTWFSTGCSDTVWTPPELHPAWTAASSAGWGLAQTHSLILPGQAVYQEVGSGFSFQAGVSTE